MNLRQLITPSTPREHGVLAAALLLQVALLFWDLQTPLGRSEWLLHLLPVAMSLLQRRRWVPGVLGCTALLCIAAGFVFSPEGGQQTNEVAIDNRSLGAIATLVLAGLSTVMLLQREATRRLVWLQQVQGALSTRLMTATDPDDVGRVACAELAASLGADVAVMFRVEEGRLRPSGGLAVDAAALPASIGAGEGLLGQMLADGQFRALSPAPAGHLTLRSALGSSAPAQLLLLPLRAQGQLVGAIELGLVAPQLQLPLVRDLAERAAETVGLPLRNALDRRERQALLEESQRQAEELQVQQEELRVNNEELEAQGQMLRESQAQLETQQAELERANAQLSLHGQTLEQQQRELLRSQADLQEQAATLAAASRYKSEFLANMSHELRTPLNSSLILSRLLVDNKAKSLTAEQVRWAQAIHDSNNDLLVLINDILDLAKIEAGHAELQSDTVRLADVAERLRATFEPMALQKKLQFELLRDPASPDTLVTDAQRLQQVLKNLLSNAFKFTAQGRVQLMIKPAAAGGVRFEVIDTGMGIAADKQQVIFEAFRQADGSTSRQFGGTGLGLSISRELVQRMGGEIDLDSKPGEGSTFGVTLPAVLVAELAPSPRQVEAVRAPALLITAPQQPAPAAAPAVPHALPGSGRRVLLAVEDDSRFAALLQSLVQEMDFDCVVASSGEQALSLARTLAPSGILLDLGLPDLSGLAVLEQLKRDPATRHVPVHVISSQDRSQAALAMGAVGHLVKPAQREQLLAAVQALAERADDAAPRRVLVVEDDAPLRDSLRQLLQSPQVYITTVGSVSEALAALTGRTFDCMVTDLALPDGSGFDLLERMSAGDSHGFPPVIVYTGRALTRDEEIRLRRYSRSIIVKGARSPERLLDEVTLFLHSVEARLPGEQQRMLHQARLRDAVLEGRCILLAEDDVRNIFALSSVFEPQGVRLEIARNGREAVDKVQNLPGIDLVLMDVMMPEMDGLEAIRRIRAGGRLGGESGAALPIIALTAKAMADDRQQCLLAGANDYLAKPIDVERLLSLCRVWMPK